MNGDFGPIGTAAGLQRPQPTSSACGDPEPLVWSDSWLVPIPLRLEPPNLDVKCLQELTHARLDYRTAAAEAWSNFNPAWKDNEVLRWWKKTSTELGARKP